MRGCLAWTAATAAAICLAVPAAAFGTFPGKPGSLVLAELDAQPTTSKFDYPSPGRGGSFLSARNLRTGRERVIFSSLRFDPTDPTIRPYGPGGFNKKFVALVDIDLSPSGRYIAARAIPYGGPTTLAVLRRSGGKPRLLRISSSRALDPVSPAWSPDGRRLAFVSAGDVFTVGVDGRGLRRVTRRAGATSVDWSKRGELAYSDARGLVRVGSGLRARKRIVGSRKAPAPVGSPDWSPSGRSLVYVRYRTIRGSAPIGGARLLRDIVRVRRDGSGRRALARTVLNGISGPPSAGPVWSPDGRRVAFSAIHYLPPGKSGFSTEDIATVAATGGRPRVTLRLPLEHVNEGSYARGGSLAWAPAR